MLEDSLRIGKSISNIEMSMDESGLDFSTNWSNRTVRIGITGSPGAGKSSFIDKATEKFLTLGYSIAILLIDPSSRQTGGALLADRTRLNPELLNRDVYIRSLSSGNSADGLPERLVPILHFLELQLFDVIIVETIGVGQESTSIRDFSNLLITLPSGDIGDIIQFFKMGTFEVADYIFFNKSDLIQESSTLNNENLISEFLASKHWGNTRPPRKFFGNTVSNNGMKEILDCLECELRKRLVHEK